MYRIKNFEIKHFMLYFSFENYVLYMYWDRATLRVILSRKKDYFQKKCFYKVTTPNVGRHPPFEVFF